MPPSESLISVVYVSSASHMLSDKEILAILTKSRANNERLGISGMLLYKEGNFMQVLEGPEHSVRELAHTIQRDSRHRGYQQLIAQPETERHFAGWSMGFQKMNAQCLESVSEEDRAAMSPFLTTSLLDEQFRTEPGAACRLLRLFKKTVR